MTIDPLWNYYLQRWLRSSSPESGQGAPRPESPVFDHLQLLKEYGVDPETVAHLYPQRIEDDEKVTFSRERDYGNVSRYDQVVAPLFPDFPFKLAAQRALLMTYPTEDGSGHLKLPYQVITLRIGHDDRTYVEILNQTNERGVVSIISLIFPHNACYQQVYYGESSTPRLEGTGAEGRIYQPLPRPIAPSESTLWINSMLHEYGFPIEEASQQANRIERNFLLSPSHFGATHSVLRGAGIDQ